MNQTGEKPTRLSTTPPFARIGVLVILVSAASAAGVSPQVWTHQSQADFVDARREQTVVDSHGDVALASDTKILLPGDRAPTVVSCVAVDGTTVYAGSGADGRIYRFPAEDGELLATLPSTFVGCLAVGDGALLAGGGGREPGVYRIDADGTVTSLFDDPSVRYIWAILPDGDTLYLATGPEGKIFRVDLDGEEPHATVLYQAGPLADNILCLAKSSDGSLQAGTDKNGLILRIDPATGSARVLLDADESEISAVCTDGKGGLFAVTGDVARTTGPSTPKKDKNGTSVTETTLQEVPVTPDPPEDVPGEPATTQAISLPPTPDPTDTRPAVRRTPEDTLILLAEESADKITIPDMPSTSPGSRDPGHAVYHIDAEGLVRTVMRQGVMFYDLARRGNRLLLATGPDGRILSVTPDGTLWGEVVDTSADQVTSLTVAADGSVAFSTAAGGAVGIIGDSLAPRGTIASQPLDAGQIARWGTIRLRYALPTGTKLSLATRSGNVAEPDDGGWSEWTNPAPARRDYHPIESPPGRFLQYRLTLEGDGRSTPTLGGLQAIYQVPNLPPKIESVKVSAADKTPKNSKEQPTRLYRIIKIDASDPNNDTLRYDIFYRRANGEVWIPLAEDLDKDTYVWDTRTAGDGQYLLRVTVDDTPSNPAPSAKTAARLSEPVTVDNTPPSISGLTVTRNNAGATVEGTSSDATSRIVEIAYAVDSAETWNVILPDDGLCDSTEETFRATIDELPQGPHRVTVRVKDLYGNTGYAGQMVPKGSR